MREVIETDEYGNFIHRVAAVHYQVVGHVHAICLLKCEDRVACIEFKKLLEFTAAHPGLCTQISYRPANGHIVIKNSQYIPDAKNVVFSKEHISWVGDAKMQKGIFYSAGSFTYYCSFCFL